MFFHGAPAHDEGVRDGRVGAALGHQREHLTLPRREVAERVPAAGQQLSHDLRVERAAALGHPAQRVEELGDVGDPVLEQVTDAVRPAGDQLGGVPLFHPLGQHQDTGGRPLVTHHQRRPQPLVGERGRHPHVDHDRVRALGADGAQERLGVARGGHDAVAGLGEQPGQALAQQDGILRDHYPHGSSTAMIVGPPDGDSTDIRPSTPDTRSDRPRSPAPAGSAPPMPSSLIMTVSVPG